MTVIDDRYHVLECVEEKQQSITYRVEDRLRPGQLLVLKLLRPSGEEERSAFANDFRVRAGLRHRGVARVYELGTNPETGSPYYTGEWVEGRPWDAVTARAEPTLLIRLCADVCSTLEHCHARGLLHLDLKPDNLLVVHEGGQLRVKVLDFGLSSGRSRGAAPGGTPAYMAPELLEGRPFDARADLYSLGISMLPPDRRPSVPGNPSPDAIPEDWPVSLTELVRRLLRRSPGERFASARAVLGHLEQTDDLPTVQIRQLMETEIPFVGRDVTLMRLREAFRRYHDDGQPDAVSAVLLVGEPGIGKTRLMREFRATVTTLPPVVVGGDPYGKEVPCPPLGDPLARLWQRKDLREGPGAEFGKALGALLPGLTPKPDPEAPEPADHEDLVKAVTDFLVECGRARPGTLFLDDLDRGDPIGLQVLRELQQREDNRWFVVGTVRSNPGLDRSDLVEVVGIDERAIDQVLRARFGEVEIDPHLVSRAHRITGGNPSFVEQLLPLLKVRSSAGARQLTMPDPEELKTPADLAAVIRARQERLPRKQQLPLGFLAVADRPLALEAICAALGVAEATMGDTLQELVDEGLVRRTASGDAARYRLVAEHHAAATYEALTAAVRQRHHAAMARLLAQAEDVEDLRDLARHLAQSGDPREAAEVLLRAGRRAMTRFDHGTAEAVLRRANFFSPSDSPELRSEIGLALGDLLVHLGRYRAAADAYREVEGLAGVGPETMGRLALQHGALCLRTGERDKGLTLLQRAVGHLEGTEARRILISAYEQLATAFMAEDRKRARHYCEVALGQIGEDSPLRETAAIHLLSGQLAAQGGDYADGLEDVSTAVEMFREAGAARGEVSALTVLASLHQDLGDADAALAATQRAVERVEDIGDRDQYAQVAIGHGDSLLLGGEYADALFWYRQGLDQALETGNQAQVAMAHMRMGRLLSNVGDPDGAAEEIERAMLLADGIDERVIAAEARVWLAAGRLRAGESEGIGRLLDRGEEVLAAVRLQRGVQSARVMRSALMLRKGQFDLAAAGLKELLQERPLPEILCTLLRLLSRLERVRPGGDLTTAYSHARGALDEAERVGNPDARWRGVEELATVCIALDDLGQAGTLLHQLQDLAEWIEPRLPDDVEGPHRIHRAIGRLSRELGVVALPQEKGAVSVEPDAGNGEIRDLKRWIGLLDALRAVAAEDTADNHLARLLDAAVELTGAERGLIRLRVESPEIQDELYWGAEPFPTSESLLEAVMRTGESTWTANAGDDPRFVDADSVLAHQLRSVLCAPLRLGDRVEGVLYVDHPFLDAAFGPQEMALLEAVASAAALIVRCAGLSTDIRRQRAEVARLTEDLAGSRGPTASATTSFNLAPAPAVPLPDIQRGQLAHSYDHIIGNHPALVLALQTIDQIVNTEIPVYLHGESGTGKELFARALHDNGHRADRPFMTLNCAAVPEQLLESELFGHIRGSFTGATADRKGLFEMAHTGTLFLDEVGDMSQGMQAKLLRVLQEGEVRRVGSTKTTHVDVRVVAASHRDLKAMVEREEFRQDVYYRLCAITVQIPPLRDRRDDIPQLLQHFLAQEARERGTPIPQLALDVPELLRSLEWPGNVRQLSNAVRTAWALGGGKCIGRAEIAIAVGQPALATAPRAPVAAPSAYGAAPSGPGASFAGRAPYPPQELSLEEREHQAITAALNQTGGNKVKAAKVLGISRRTLYRKLERYGM